MFRNGDNQQGVCPLEFLQEVWHQAYPLHYWRNVKPSINKRKPFHEYNINKHICSSVRCINNILREQNARHENLSFAPITEEKDRFIITYKNPVYVKDITTCNSATRKSDKHSKMKENVPPKRKKSSDNVDKNIRKCSYASDVTTVSNENTVNCITKPCKPIANKSIATQTNYVNDTNCNPYINDLMLYTRLNCKNITDKVCDKYYTKTRNTVLWYINDNLIQIKQRQNSINFEPVNGRIKIPISSTFRPLDISRISNYIHSHKNNFRYPKNLPTQFRLHTSISRPLTIRQF